MVAGKGGWALKKNGGGLIGATRLVWVGVTQSPAPGEGQWWVSPWGGLIAAEPVGGSVSRLTRELKEVLSPIGCLGVWFKNPYTKQHGLGGVFCYPSGCVGRDWSCKPGASGAARYEKRQGILTWSFPPEGARPRRLGRKGKLRHRAPSALPGQEGPAPAAPARAEVGADAFLCFLVPAFPMSSGARGRHLAGTSLLLPLSPAPRDEGTAKPASPAAISCPIRRAIKNNRQRRCPGPAPQQGRLRWLPGKQTNSQPWWGEAASAGAGAVVVCKARPISG